MKRPVSDAGKGSETRSPNGPVQSPASTAEAHTPKAHTTQVRYARMLRWYPKAWREENGAALLATMLDSADAQGRLKPSTGERISSVAHGVGTRLDAKLAMRSGIAAIVVALAVGVVFTWGLQVLDEAGCSWLLPALNAGLGPALTMVSVCSLLRERGAVTGPRALGILALAIIAVGLTAATWQGLSLAFDAADSGTADPFLSRIVGPLFLVAWATGTAAAMLLLDSVYAGRATWRRMLALVLAGGFGALFAGVLLLMPYMPAAAALTVTVLAVAQAQRDTKVAPASTLEHQGAQSGQDTQESTTAAPGLSVKAAVPGLLASRILAGVSGVGGTVGVVYALTGSSWGGANDGTQAMGQGITIGLVSAVPLLAVLGLRFGPSLKRSPRHIWGPLLLAALACGSMAAAYTNAPSWDGMELGMLTASAFGGAALAWFLFPMLQGTRALRVLLGALIGAIVTAFLGIMVLPMLVFALPLAATALVIWPRRKRPAGYQAMPAQAT